MPSLDSEPFLKTFQGLYQNIITLLPQTKNRVVQVLGVQDGGHVSKITREFAKFVAVGLKKSVLFLDAGPTFQGQCNFFPVVPRLGWVEAAQDSRLIQEAIQQVADSSLFLSCLSINGKGTAIFLESPRLADFLAELRPHFDLLVIDSQSFSVNPDSLLLTAKVDGVVLVVEAEKTRWQAVDKVVQRIAAQGGNVLGVILNNRRYAIPQCIYSRM